MQQTHAVFRLLSRRLDARLAELEAIFGDDVPAFNALREQRGIAANSCTRTDS